MAKKSVKQVTKRPAPMTAAGKTGEASPVGPAAAGVGALQCSTPAKVARPLLLPAAVPSSPVVPVAGRSTPLREASAKETRSLPPPGTPSAQAVILKRPETEAVGAGGPKSPAPSRVKVTFALLGGEAERVSVSGDFNGWSPDASPMRRDEGGRWETTLELGPGRYEYKFIADGQWMPDPLAGENVRNPHGTLNSVIVVRA